MKIVDTDILIDIQRGYPPAVAWIAGLKTLPVVMGLSLLELVQDARNRKEVVDAFMLVDPFPIEWPTEEEMYISLNYFGKYHLSHNLGLIDAILAASAVNRNAALQTFNLKHYKAVPGLRIERPYSK